MATTKETPETRYRVTCPYLTVKTMALAGVIPGRSGWTVVGLYRDGLLPADAPGSDIERLLRGGMIEPIEEVPA